MIKSNQDQTSTSLHMHFLSIQSTFLFIMTNCISPFFSSFFLLLSLYKAWLGKLGTECKDRREWKGSLCWQLGTVSWKCLIRLAKQLVSLTARLHVLITFSIYSFLVLFCCLCLLNEYISPSNPWLPSLHIQTCLSLPGWSSDAISAPAPSVTLWTT